MGDPGFIKHDREDGQDAVDDRLATRRAVHRLRRRRVQTQASRCMDCGVPTTCRVARSATDPGMERPRLQGRLGRSLRRLHATNNFPSSPAASAPPRARTAAPRHHRPGGHHQDARGDDRRQGVRPAHHRAPRSAPARPSPSSAAAPGLACAQQLNRAGHRSRSSRRTTAPVAWSCTASRTTSSARRRCSAASTCWSKKASIRTAAKSVRKDANA